MCAVYQAWATVKTVLQRHICKGVSTIFLLPDGILHIMGLVKQSSSLPFFCDNKCGERRGTADVEHKRRHLSGLRRGSQESQQGREGDPWYWSVYFALPTNMHCFTNRTNSHSGPSACINECRVPELMDLTSPVTRKVLRLQICSTEVQCQRVPVWSHVQGERVQQFIGGNAFYVLPSASGEGNRVRQASVG